MVTRGIRSRRELAAWGEYEAVSVCESVLCSAEEDLMRWNVHRKW